MVAHCFSHRVVATFHRDQIKSPCPHAGNISDVIR